MTETPGTEIAVPNANLGERMQYAQALAAADLLPASYRRKPANVLLAMEYGHALGLDTITAMQSVHVIDGKPTASAQLIGALVRRAGHRLRVTGDDKKAVAEIVRSDDPEFVFRSEWTLDRAGAAGLANRGVWKQYPAAMLKARAITEVARDACPEALAGVAYTPEELGVEGAAWPTNPQNAPEPVITVEEVSLPSQTVEPVRTQSEPSGKASAAQLKAIATMLKVCGANTHETRHAAVGKILNVNDYNSADLTKAEASSVIEALKPMADDPDPLAALEAFMKS
jgi:hypothetical protein